MTINPLSPPGPKPGEELKPDTASEPTGLLPGRKRWLLALVLFILVEAAALAGLFERLEMDLYDAWFRLRGVQDPGNQVVIVAIDEPSLEELGRFPWPRSVHGRLLEKLKEARVVGFDLDFGVPTVPAEDQALAAAVAEHGRVVLATKFSFERQANGEIRQVLPEPKPEIMEIMAGAAQVGFVNIPTDTDDVVRNVTIVDVNAIEVPVPAFGLAVVMAGDGLNEAQLALQPGRLTAGRRVVPVDGLNRAGISFWGPRGAFKTHSYAEVLNGKVPAAEFKDKIVLVGATAVILHDDLPTPFTTSNLVLSGSLRTPGVEIHASVIQSLLEGRWYRRVAPAVNLGFLLLIGFFSTVSVSGRGPWLGLAGVLAVAAVAVGSALGSWWAARLWLNLAAPLAFIFLNYTVLTATDFIQAEMGRRRTREMFRRYVSPAVVEELMRDPENIALGGQRQLVTVMFCDIRGFTSYSENKAPEQVVSRLNQYLSAMTRVIFRYGGTLDKYLGDGLMAIFGAPVYYPDHIQRAIRTAVEIQAEVEELNRLWAAQNEPPLQVGVGINTGEVLVGNIGSSERMDYTAIGEDVNLAARMEGLTKSFHNLIIISERSVRMLDRPEQLPSRLQYLGQAEVKGFTASVGVYTVVNEKS